MSAAHCTVWESMEPVLPTHVGLRYANPTYKTTRRWTRWHPVGVGAR